jgi:hypothetical protein
MIHNLGILFAIVNDIESKLSIKIDFKKNTNLKLDKLKEQGAISGCVLLIIP